MSFKPGATGRCLLGPDRYGPKGRDSILSAIASGLLTHGTCVARNAGHPALFSLAAIHNGGEGGERWCHSSSMSPIFLVLDQETLGWVSCPFPSSALKAARQRGLLRRIEKRPSEPEFHKRERRREISRGAYQNAEAGTVTKSPLARRPIHPPSRKGCQHEAGG